MEKIKVGHFVRGFLHPTETFIRNQIKSLTRYEPKVYCHHFLQENTHLDFDVVSVLEILPKQKRLLQYWAYKLSKTLLPGSARIIAEHLMKKGIKILHFHYLVEARFYLPIMRYLKLPTIVSGYGWDVSSFPLKKFGYGRKYIQPIFREMDLFIAMSEDMRRDMMKIGCPDSKIVVHYFGNEINRFVFPERQYKYKTELRILFCGRLAGKKAPHLVLNALKILEDEKNNMPDWKLVFVGDGPLRGLLEAKVSEFGWNDKVDFIGHIPYHDIRFVEEYKKADIYILPSMTVNGEKEGIPGSLIEAMASGLPCISTHHAGIPSVITDGHDGFLAREGDTRAIAGLLEILLREPDVRERIGKAAAKKALVSFNLQDRTKVLESIYDNILNTKNNLSN